MNQFAAETKQRLEDRAKAIPFSIDYLDDAKRGILPTDLIVVGAGTGIGKTEFAVNVALGAIECGKSVCLYALEAERYEIHRRIKYKFIAQYFVTHRQEFPSLPENTGLNYFDWSTGKLDSILLPLEDSINEKLHRLFDSNLRIVTPDGPMSAEDMTEIGTEWMGYDLIIVDHLHYLEAESDSMSENQVIKKAVSQLRNFVNTRRKPVILFSHLRKQTKGDKSAVPTLEELHGSSEISKQANLVVTIGKAFQYPVDGSIVDGKPGETFIRICKARSAAPGCQNVVARVRFDLGRNTYSEGYTAYTTDRWAEKLTELTEKMRWMRRHK